MTNFKIFLRDGKLFGNEFPEIPPVSFSANQDAARMRSYNRSVESACATAIEVIGIDESALILNGFACEDDFYSLPSGWTVEYSRELIGTPEKVCYNCLNGAHHLCAAPTTCVCNHIDEPWWKKIARLVPAKASGGAVIPEGSEKTLTFQQCLREEFLFNTQNYPKEYHNLFNEKFRRAETRFKEQSDKPAIDDTLKGVDI